MLNAKILFSAAAKSKKQKAKKAKKAKKQVQSAGNEKKIEVTLVQQPFVCFFAFFLFSIATTRGKNIPTNE
jgi:hypothetical protein